MIKRIKRFIANIKPSRVEPIIVKTSDTKLLKDKTALITGGSGGIGYAIAKSFIECGCKVIIAGTNINKLEKICLELGDNCKFIQLNLRNINEFNDKINEASKYFGKINILVNSAGIHIPRKGLDFLNSTEQEYDQIMSLNLKGTYFLTQAFAKYLINNKIGGHILIISSQSALEPAWSPYRLSKWGIKGITAGLAQNLIKYGIIVNAIGPGPTATKMQDYEQGNSIYTDLNPIYRYTMPEEIAEYAKLLVSDLGNTIVGDTIYMSGGRGIIEIR